MNFDETQKWIHETAPLYLGNMVKFMFLLSGEAQGEDLAHLGMEAADTVKDLSGAGDGDKAIARGFATAWGRVNPDTQAEYTFEEANNLRELSLTFVNLLPVNYKKATQFNELMLQKVLELPFYLDSKIILLDFLGVSRSNAIVANAEVYKYHPDQALADPAGEGAWLK